MASVDPRVLRGFRDYLPSDMIARQQMLRKIEAVFESYGFLPLMTPALEYSAILLGKYGDEGDSLLYRFRDNGDRDVALRYDLTVPLARVVAQYPDLPRPFRRYQIAPVWRAEKPARGRFREFVQCDGDIVGSNDQAADAEIIQLAADMLRALGVSFRIQINNRKVLTGLMERIGVAPGEPELGVLRTVDKLPKIGESKTRELLARDNGLDAERIDAIFDFLGLGGDAPDGDDDERARTTATLEKLAEFFPEASIGRRGQEELSEVFAILDAVELSDAVRLDLSIARGLNYYTGTIYETFLTDLDGFGAVMSGGRYDGLIGVFAKGEIPGVGISLGLDRLLAGLRELDMADERQSVASVLVTVFDANSVTTSARVARVIREAGVACELFPQAAKIGKQLRYAERSGKSIAVIVGPDEVARSVVQVKDLAERSQSEVPLAGLGEYLGGRLTR